MAYLIHCSAEYLKVVNMSGKLKSSRRQAAELHFDFPVESLGKVLPTHLSQIKHQSIFSLNPDVLHAL